MILADKGVDYTCDRRVVAWAAVADHSRFLMASSPDDLLQRPLRLVVDAAPVVRGEKGS